MGDEGKRSCLMSYYNSKYTGIVVCVVVCDVIFQNIIIKYCQQYRVKQRILSVTCLYVFMYYVSLVVLSVVCLTIQYGFLLFNSSSGIKYNSICQSILFYYYYFIDYYYFIILASRINHSMFGP